MSPLALSPPEFRASYDGVNTVQWGPGQWGPGSPASGGPGPAQWGGGVGPAAREQTMSPPEMGESPPEMGDVEAYQKYLNNSHSGVGGVGGGGFSSVVSPQYESQEYTSQAGPGGVTFAEHDAYSATPEGQYPAGYEPSPSPEGQYQSQEGQYPAGYKPSPDGQYPAGYEPSPEAEGQYPAGYEPSPSPGGQYPAGCQPSLEEAEGRQYPAGAMTPDRAEGYEPSPGEPAAAVTPDEVNGRTGGAATPEEGLSSVNVIVMDPGRWCKLKPMLRASGCSA